MCVVKYYVYYILNIILNIIYYLFVHTIKFHSYDYDNASFIERINNFHFSCHRYYSFKSCLKILRNITITLSAIGVKLDGEDEQVKKRKKDLLR